MKIKKIKLLKALALTGAFGIVATVPVIVSSCSSTSDNNGGNGNNNNGDQGGNEQQKTEVTPTIKTEVSLSGALSKIYDGTKSTSDLIAEDIKANPTNYFDNGEALKDLIKDATVSVNGGFTESTFKGEAYDVWSVKQGVKKGVYAQASKQLDIKSINDLETQLGSSDDIKAVCNAIPALTLANGSDYKVEKNALKLEGDLLHVNISAKDNTTAVSMDLAIPVSDLNLKIDGLKISVSGTGIKESTDLTTNYKFNIGIDSTVKELTGASGTLSSDQTDVNKALVALGYATEKDGTYTLDNDKLSDALGLYNCSFEAVSSEAVSGQNDQFTITLKATPNTGYVWEDGTNTPKEGITFVATLK